MSNRPLKRRRFVIQDDEDDEIQDEKIGSDDDDRNRSDDEDEGEDIFDNFIKYYIYYIKMLLKYLLIKWVKTK